MVLGQQEAKAGEFDFLSCLWKRAQQGAPFSHRRLPLTQDGRLEACLGTAGSPDPSGPSQVQLQSTEPSDALPTTVGHEGTKLPEFPQFKDGI